MITAPLVTVILYGHLAKQFGKTHKLAIKTPAEAIRALSANYKDFKQSIMLDGQMAYRVIAGKEDRADEIGLHLPAGKNKTIKIIPVIAGSNGGFGRVLLGAALIGASFIPGLQGVGIAGLSLTSALSSVGISMVLGGVSQMLMSAPKSISGGSERPNNRPSYAFNGPINTIAQGNCVPVAYGKRIRVGSQVISAGTETVNL